MNYILGGDGFVGSALIRALDAIPLQHNLLDDPRGKFNDLQQGDIVFHAAHYGSIDTCVQEKEATRAINVAGTKLFFDVLHNQGIFPVYFSTNMVFDGNEELYTEADTPNPTTEYGKQKYEVEQYIQATFERYLSIRMTKVYGPGSTSFIDSWILNVRDNKPIRAAHDSYAAPVYINDAVSAIQDLLPTTYSGICHISGPRERSMQEIAGLITSHTGANTALIEPMSIAEVSHTEKRSVHNSLACDTLKKQGCRTPRDIPEILREFYP